MTTITIVLGVLRLAEVIDWSWWVILSPMLFGVASNIIYFALIKSYEREVRRSLRRLS